MKQFILVSESQKQGRKLSSECKHIDKRFNEWNSESYPQFILVISLDETASPHIPALIVHQIERMTVLVVDFDDLRRIRLFRIFSLAVSNLHFGTETKFILINNEKNKQGWIKLSGIWFLSTPWSLNSFPAGSKNCLIFYPIEYKYSINMVRLV